LMDNLATHGLTGMAEGLRKAGVVSMTALRNHTVAELLESLQRRGIRGKDYVFSSVERRTLIRMGMEEGDPPPAGAPTAAPPVRPDAAPAAADADLAAWLHHKAGDPPPLTGGAPPPPPPGAASSVLSGTPHAQAMLARAVSELEPQAVSRLTRQLARVFKLEDAIMQPENGSACTLEEAIDTLDALLDAGKWSIADLRQPEDGMRVVNRFVVKLCVQEQRAVDERKSRSTPVSDGEQQVNVAKSLAGAVLEGVQGSTSSADHKAAAEISASEKRLKAVLLSASDISSLRSFAQHMQSDADPKAKMAAYEDMANNATIAELLKSSHVRAPKGAASVDSPHALGVVGDWREARAGILTAARDLLRRTLPVHADAMKLAEAVFSGKMSSGDFSMKALSEPAKPASWLGKPTQETGSKDKKPTEKVLVTVMTPIHLAFKYLQPQDKDMALTLAEINCEVAKGLERSGVAGAVDIIYAPLMRAYDEGYDAFQKSASAALPVMSKVWAEERALAIEAYSMQVAPAAAQPQAPAATDTAALKELKELFLGLKSSVSTLKKKVKAGGGYASSAGESEDEDDDGGAEKKKKKKKTTSAKMKDIKAKLKEAEDKLAAAGGQEG
jgi:hypothetical protein